MDLKHIVAAMVFLVFALTMVSCAREDEMANVPYTDYVELHDRAECPLGEEKRIAEMAPSDVIVAVNGYPLTKQDWDDRVRIETKFLLRRRGSNQFMVDEQIKDIKNNDGFLTLQESLPEVQMSNPDITIKNVEALLIRAMGCVGNTLEMHFKPEQKWEQLALDEREYYVDKLK